MNGIISKILDIVEKLQEYWKHLDFYDTKFYLKHTGKYYKINTMKINKPPNEQENGENP